MEKQIFELLRENKVGHAKAWYITRELLCLYNVMNIVCPECGCNKIQHEGNNDYICLSVLCNFRGQIMP